MKRTVSVWVQKKAVPVPRTNNAIPTWPAVLPLSGLTNPLVNLKQKQVLFVTLTTIVQLGISAGGATQMEIVSKLVWRNIRLKMGKLSSGIGLSILQLLKNQCFSMDSTVSQELLSYGTMLRFANKSNKQKMKIKCQNRLTSALLALPANTFTVQILGSSSPANAPYKTQTQAYALFPARISSTTTQKNQKKYGTEITATLQIETTCVLKQTAVQEITILGSKKRQNRSSP